MNNILQFSDANLTSDSFLLMDTSFILGFSGYDTLGKGRVNLASREKECKNLITEIVNVGAMFAISIVTYEEMVDIIQRDLFKNNSCECEADIKRLKQIDPTKHYQLIRTATDDVNEYIRGLTKTGVYYPEIIGASKYPKIEDINQIRVDYQIPYMNDAKQISIALKEGLTHFVTLDKDFNNVTNDNLTILVDSSTYNQIK